MRHTVPAEQVLHVKFDDTDLALLDAEAQRIADGTPGLSPPGRGETLRILVRRALKPAQPARKAG